MDGRRHSRPAHNPAGHQGVDVLDIICKLPPLVRVGIGIAVGIILVLLDLHIVVLGVASALFLAAWEVGVALWDVATTMPTVVPTPTTATPNPNPI